MIGKVYLVGAGPGDPGLITVKGRECIEKADVIVYDYLASPTLLRYSNSTAETIYVGKQGGDHTLSQDGINALLVEKAKTGATVARLKGGDPFIFGRGGEEAEVLIEAGIPFEIVPGVTSAIAAPAYAGIPLTHRKFTSTVAFITGHEDPTKDSTSIDWSALAKGIGTLVFLMGVKNLPNIVGRLVENGRSPDTPVALVRWGTTTKQKTVAGTLSNIAQRVEEAKLKAPAIIVVGDVVKLRDEMKWFENRPLLGRKIVVTRAREQASNLVEQLESLGAEVMECPTIKIVDPESYAPLDEALSKLASYQWVVFTSVNGVKYFFGRLFAKGLDARALGGAKIAAIGPVTAQTLMQYGLKTDILPKNYRAESVVEAFSNENVSGKRVLLPRAEEARPVIPVELEKMGATVDEISVYRTVQDRGNADALVRDLKDGAIDMVTFTSSSTVKNFKALIPEENFSDLTKGVDIACIGPITADTAVELGFEVRVTADEYTIPGLCDVIVAHYGSM